jgi:hypothetical protein
MALPYVRKPPAYIFYMSSFTHTDIRKSSCKTWHVIMKYSVHPLILWMNGMLSVTWKEVHKLQKFENKVLRKIFGAMKDEVVSVRIEMSVGK